MMWVEVRNIIVTVLLVLPAIVIILAVIVRFLSRARFHAHEGIVIFFLCPLVLVVRALSMLLSTGILCSQ